MAYGRPGVYISERLTPAPLPTASAVSAAGACVGEFAQGPVTITRVTSWYDFTKLFGGYNNAYPATFGVGEFFKNGGTELYVRRIIASDAAAASVTVTDGTGAIATFTAITKGADGNNLRIKLERVGTTAYFNLGVYRENGTDVGIVDDVLLEQYNSILFNDANSSDYIVSVLAAESQYISATTTTLAQTSYPTANLYPLTLGSDGAATINGASYTGVLDEFVSLDRTLVIFAPEVMAKQGSTQGLIVHNGLIAKAEANDWFAVLDTDKNLDVASAGTYATSLTASSYAAVYYPNILISDPNGRNSASVRKIGPAGSVAGLYLNTDSDFGPFKAPAGLRASLAGAVTTERQFTSAELDTMNSALKPLNAIRQIPGAGVVVMGARTLKQDGTANRYVSMRRSLLYIKKELRDITKFALFENNDDDLWGRVRTAITAFLNGYHNQGGLAGTTDAEAFFVKCDSSNNTAQTIANGEIHIEVGIALEYPAEFVVINLSQKTAA